MIHTVALGLLIIYGLGIVAHFIGHAMDAQSARRFRKEVDRECRRIEAKWSREQKEVKSAKQAVDNDDRS